MDKETLSNYGWIVICVVVVAIMITFATPFGNAITGSTQQTVDGLYNVYNEASLNVGYTDPVMLNSSNFTKGESEPVRFRSSAPLSAFKEFRIDDVVVPEANYTLSSGSTIVDVNASYMEALGVGQHKAEIVSTLNAVDKVAAANFTVESTALASGLYATGTTNLIKSWDELISEGILSDSGTIVSGKKSELAGDLVLPDDWTSIPEYAFDGCTSLTNVVIPDGVTVIEMGAFSGCTNLALTSIPNGVTYIGDYAFYYCANLALTSLPNSLASNGLGDYAFDHCTNLALTSLPDNLRNIGIGSFYGCTNLALTSLPDGLTGICTDAFNGCAKIESIQYKGTTYNSKSALATALSNNGVDVASSAFNNTGLQ